MAPADVGCWFGWWRLIDIQIVAIGKDKDPWVTAGVEHYTRLLKRFARLDIRLLPSPEHGTKTPAAVVKRREAELLNKLSENRWTIALSDKGKSLDSEELATRLEQWINTSGGRLRFLIGGPYGLEESVLREADVVLSLSPLTFSHQLVRLVLLEQLYRAFSILHHLPYHK